MRGKILTGILAFAMLGLLIPTNAFAEDIRISGIDFPANMDVYAGDRIIFLGDEAMKGIKIVANNKGEVSSTGVACDGPFHKGSSCIIDISRVVEILGYGTMKWIDPNGDKEGKLQVKAESEKPITAKVSDESYEAVSEQAKAFKEKLEAKLQAEIEKAKAPLEMEIKTLKSSLAIEQEAKNTLLIQVDTLRAELTTAQNTMNANVVSVEQLSTANATIEQYKKDADNWKAVALEQLRVMAEVLGLF